VRGGGGGCSCAPMSGDNVVARKTFEQGAHRVQAGHWRVSHGDG
jgi:protein subunit release factor A